MVLGRENTGRWSKMSDIWKTQDREDEMHGNAYSYLPDFLAVSMRGRGGIVGSSD